MKKSISIFLLTIYLISLTELNQLVKLPVLIEHFIEHKQKNTDLSLLEFLDMHYAHGDVKDADYDKDMKLPFKSYDGCISISTIAFIPNTFEYLDAKPVFTECKSYFFFTEKFLEASYLSSIWQPPKSC